MTEGALLGVIVRVALPVMLTNLLLVGYQLINALFLGRLGAGAVAAVAASGPMFGVLLSLGSGLATAGAVLIAQYSGARQSDVTDHVAAQTLLMVAGVASGFALIGFATGGPLLDFIGVTPEIRALTWSYLAIAYVGMLPQFGFMAIQAMLQAAGEVRFALWTMVASVAVNALLDPIFIFGFGWGVAGAALATLAAQLAALALGLWRILSGRSALHLRPVHFRPDLAHMRRAFGLGLPASIEQGTRTFGSLVLMSTAAQFGTLALATYGLGTRVMLLFFVPLLGLSAATAAVVGQNIGAGRLDRAEQAGRLAAWLSFAILTGLGLLLVPLAGPLMTLLAPGEPELIREGVVFVYIFAPFLGFFAVPQVLLGVFRGAGSTRQSMTISLVMQWVFQMPAAWALAFLTPLGPLGVWWSYAVANIAATIITILWFARGPWRRRLVAAPAQD